MTYSLENAGSTNPRRYVPFLVVGGILAGVGAFQLVGYFLLNTSLILALAIIDLTTGAVFLIVGIGRKRSFKLSKQLKVKWGAILVIAGCALGALLVIGFPNIRWLLGTAEGFGIYGAGSDGANVYTYGSTFNEETQRNEGILVKWDPRGNQLWNRICDEDIMDLWIDDVGNAYTLGTSLVKWNPNGNVLWNKTWSTAERGAIYGDNTSNVYTVVQLYHDGPVWLAKWNALTGYQLWNRTCGSIALDFGKIIWADAAGNVYLVGKDGFHLRLMKFSADKTSLWNRTSTFTIQYGCSVISGDVAGNVYTFASMNKSSTDWMAADTILVKWNASGSEVWNRTWDGGSWDYSYAVWCDDISDVYTCGQSYLPRPNIRGAVFNRWNASGNLQWTRTWENQLLGDFCGSIWKNDANHAVILSYVGSRSGGILVKEFDVAGNLVSDQAWAEYLGNLDYFIWIVIISGLIAITSISAIMRARSFLKERGSISGAR